MAVSFSGGVVNATKRTIQALTYAYIETDNTDTTATIGTVPAGKVWRIVGALVNAKASSEATSKLYFNNVLVVSSLPRGSSILGSPDQTVWYSGYYEAFVLNAGESITYTSNGTDSRHQVQILYIEENA